MWLDLYSAADIVNEMAESNEWELEHAKESEISYLNTCLFADELALDALNEQIDWQATNPQTEEWKDPYQVISRLQLEAYDAIERTESGTMMREMYATMLSEYDALTSYFQALEEEIEDDEPEDAHRSSVKANREDD